MDLALELVSAEERVTLDGNVQRPGVNPFPGLKAAMSPLLWRRVSAALNEVLTGADGDSRLFDPLRGTERADQSRRAS
jgi:hypothetical protein